MKTYQRLFLTACALTFVISSPAQTPRPNFVFIIGDDISAEDWGCYGNRAVRTPNIDRLAAESTRFDRGYLTISSCSPSRCSFLTGRYPHNLEAASELHGKLPPGVAMFPKELRDAGYYSAQAGKTHFGENWNELTGPAVAAFDVGGEGKDAAGPGGESQWLARLRDRPKDKPFFFWLASHDAHRPWGANIFSGLNHADDIRVPPYLLDTPETREDLARYYDEITRFDFHIGEIVRELARQGVLDNTVIIVTSDNGRPFPHSKTQLYDDGIRMPLLIRWPHPNAQAATTRALVSAIDVAPTILELAGVPKPATVQGVSLVPILKDPGASVRDHVFAEHNWHNYLAHIRLLRTGNLVYLRNDWPELPLMGPREDPSSVALQTARAAGGLTALQANVYLAPRPREELYNLGADPVQAHNLIASANRAQLEKLRTLMDRWVAETGDSTPSAAERTPADTDYDTGKKIPGFQRGVPPGASTNALNINHPGPVRD